MMRPKTRSKPALGLGLLAALLSLALAGCAAVSREKLSRPEAPAAYQRAIMLVLERPDFSPVAGAAVRIESETPTRLLKPAGGTGRTDARGGLELLFEPLPHYEQSAWAGGDIIVDYPVKARIFIDRPGRASLEVLLDDRESFARYADPLYQGLNRDPEPGLTYYTVTLP